MFLNMRLTYDSILPLDLYKELFNHLPAISVLRFSQVNKLFYSFADNERIWEKIVLSLNWTRSDDVSSTSFGSISNIV